MQNIDKISIVVAALIILGGVVWSVAGSDPGSEFSAEINDKIATINDNLIEANPPKLVPPDVQGEISNRFQPADPGDFPGWSFHRRPARVVKREIVETLPPELSPPAVCAVEVTRDSGRVLHRVRGIRAPMQHAERVSETLQMREGNGEWTDRMPIPGGEQGTEFEAFVGDLEPGKSYAYRVVTLARSSTSIPFPGGQASAVASPSEPMLYPPDVTWHATGAQAATSDATGRSIPGRVTINRTSWDWEKGKVKQEAVIAVEGDGKALFDSTFSLFQIREPRPLKIFLRGASIRERMTLEDRAKPLPLMPTSWESADAPCGGEEASAGQNASAIPPNSNGGGTSHADDETKPKKPKDDDDSGGLFGGDDD